MEAVLELIEQLPFHIMLGFHTSSFQVATLQFYPCIDEMESQMKAVCDEATPSNLEADIIIAAPVSKMLISQQ